LGRREKQPRGVIDTSVLVAGIAGFKSQRTIENPSASLLRNWLDDETFTWLVTEAIVSEYKGVLTRLGVRRNLVGEIINLLREVAEFVDVRTESDVSPDPNDNAFCACAEQGHAAFIVTLNRRDFPQKKLVAKVISPGDPIPTTRRSRSSVPNR
jgi:putative PIN family toxin of toxin-antitoxin system